MQIEIQYHGFRATHDNIVVDIKQEKDIWKYDFSAVHDENGKPTARPICAPFTTRTLPWIQQRYKDTLIIRSLQSEMDQTDAEIFATHLTFELYKVSDAYLELQATRSGYSYATNIQGIPTCNIKGKLHPAMDIYNGVFYLGYRFVDELGNKKEWMIDNERHVHTPEGLLQDGLILKDKAIVGEQRWINLTYLEQKPINALNLYKTIKHKAVNHIWFSNPLAYDILTLWIMGTYLYWGFSSYPYFHLSGTPDSGKSTVQRLTSCIAFNGYFTESITGSSIFRYVEEMRSTMCIDEQEFLANENNLEAISILNSGYHRAGNATRQEQQTNSNGDKKFVTMSFSTFSPKMLSGIRGLDRTLKTRSISVPMKPSSDPKYSRRPIDDTDPSWQAMRDELYIWAIDSFEKIQECYSDARGQKSVDIKNRMWQKYHALLSLAIYFKEINPQSDIYDNVIKFIQEDQEPTLEYDDYLIDLCYKVLWFCLNKFPNPSDHYSFELIRTEAATMLGAHPPYDFKSEDSPLHFLKDINKMYNTLGYKSIKLGGNYRGIKATKSLIEEEAKSRGIALNTPLIRL